MSASYNWLLANLYPHNFGTADPLFAVVYFGSIFLVVMAAFAVISKVQGFLGTFWNFCFDDSVEMEKVPAEFEGNFENGEVRSFGASDYDFREKRGFMSRILKGAWADAIRIVKFAGNLILNWIITPVFYVGWALIAAFIAVATAGAVAAVKLAKLAVYLIDGFFGILAQVITGVAKVAWTGLSWIGRGLYRVASLPVNFVLDMIGNWVTSDLNAEIEEEVVEVEVESSGYTWYQNLWAHITKKDRDLQNANRDANADRIVAAIATINTSNTVEVAALAHAVGEGVDTMRDLASAVINSDSVYEEDDVVSDENAAEWHALQAVLAGNIDEVPVDIGTGTGPGLPVTVGPVSQDETVELEELGAKASIGAIGTLEALMEADLAEQGNRRREVMEMTRNQLRAECKRRRLPVSGNKAVLQERILQAI